MNLTNEDIQEIIRILDATPYARLHLETAGFKLTLERGPGKGGGWTQARQTLSEPAVMEDEDGAVEEKAAEAPAAPAVSGNGLAEIRAGLPGTFYRAPKPGAAPFVEIGSSVDEHTVIAIIETMKLMNSATAGVSGTIVEICVANAEPIEAGQVLMRVEAAAP